MVSWRDFIRVTWIIAPGKPRAIVVSERSSNPFARLTPNLWKILIQNRFSIRTPQVPCGSKMFLCRGPVFHLQV